MSRGVGIVGRPVAKVEGIYSGDGLSPGYVYLNDFFNAGSSTIAPFTLVTDSVAHTKGAWVELVAATSVELDGIVLRVGVHNSTGVDSSLLLDIGTGAAASETVVAPNNDFGYNNTVTMYPIPVRIAKGSRIAARVQGARISASISVAVSAGLLYSTGRRSPVALVAMGVDPATSAATLLTAPGGNNTESAWTEIIAATPQPFQGLIFNPGGGTGTTFSGGSLLVDLGVGALGSETGIMENIVVQPTNAELVNFTPQPRIVWRHVPAGTRLVGRYQRNAISIVCSASVVGIPY